MRLGYRPALDGVRALAITLVVLRHATGFPADGALGVDIFFVLSGFLITSLLLDERVRYGAVSLKNFYRRRALRLLPALFVVLAFVLCVSVVAYLRHGTSLAKPIFGVVAGAGYFTNIALTTKAGVVAMPSSLTHLWSLAAEEQFYVVWPVLLFVVLRARLRLALWMLVAALVVATAQQLRLYFEDAWGPRLLFGVDTRSTSIVVGCLLALLLASDARSRVEVVGKRVAPIAIPVLVLLVVLDLDKAMFAGPLLLAGIATAVLILRALDGTSLLSKALALSPLVFLGRISYSLYLWHIPILLLFGVTRSEFTSLTIPAVATAVACATASYYLVEMPFLRRKRKFEPRSVERAEPRHAPETPALVPAGRVEAAASPAA
jgi:peptidoglycan/LPS O-acetylase OafA/YrhL